MTWLNCRLVRRPASLSSRARIRLAVAILPFISSPARPSRTRAMACRMAAAGPGSLTTWLPGRSKPPSRASARILIEQGANQAGGGDSAFHQQPHAAFPHQGNGLPHGRRWVGFVDDLAVGKIEATLAGEGPDLTSPAYQDALRQPQFAGALERLDHIGIVRGGDGDGNRTAGARGVQEFIEATEHRRSGGSREGIITCGKGRISLRQRVGRIVGLRSEEHTSELQSLPTRGSSDLEFIEATEHRRSGGSREGIITCGKGRISLRQRVGRIVGL